MPERAERPRPLHENLDTSYLDLAALLVYLEARGFTGLVHVALDEYEADVILRAGEKTTVRERSHATGETAEGEAALRRLTVRAQEPGGLVSVYELSPEEAEREASAGIREQSSADSRSELQESEEEARQREMFELMGEVAAATERAVVIAGGDFEAALHAARLTLAEDFPFLNPFARSFEYAGGEMSLQSSTTGERLFVSGVCEMLRRTVEHVAVAEQKIGVRKDAARELSILLRRRRSRLERFKLTARQLERIAGMKLL